MLFRIKLLEFVIVNILDSFNPFNVNPFPSILIFLEMIIPLSLKLSLV